MNPNKDVSVVIPVYQAEGFIADTLATVAAQSIQPLEVVIVDDGSSDSTCNIIELFSRANPTINIRLIRKPHEGPGSARNAGVHAATGSWIAFLDSDDLWYSNKLEQIASAHRSMPDANIICHNELHRRLDKSEVVLNYTSGFNPDLSLTNQLYYNNRFSTSAVICRRDLILSCGGFDITFPSAQDYELWLRMSPNLNVLFVNEVLGIYVDRAGNISSGRMLSRFKNLLRVRYRHRDKVNTIVFSKTLMRMFVSLIYRGLLRSLVSK